MPITPKELIDRFKNLKNDYINERVSLVLRAADDATALMRLRVIERKNNAQGGIFGIYADSTWEGGTFPVRRKDGSWTVIEKKGKKEKALSREINFSDTNRMWTGVGGPGDGIKARLFESSEGVIRVIIQPHDDQNRIEVLGILEDKFGKIVEWSEQEQGLIITIWEKKIREIIKRNGF